MITRHKHDDLTVEVKPLQGGGNRICLYRGRASAKALVQAWKTRYSADLINRIHLVKGSGSLIEEIQRDEDPRFVQTCLEKDILAYIEPGRLVGKRLLDFGCGSGASSMILGRLFPETEILGIDLNAGFLDVAKARGEFHGLKNVHFLLSPAGDRLPDGIGTFDFVVLSAVFEHLLPGERAALLPRIWEVLAPGGILFLDQTPWRFFFFEGHTTYLPFLNYMPDRFAHWTATRLSRKLAGNESWEELLRKGVRGGTVREILHAIRKNSPGEPRLLEPHRLGINNRIDLWYNGYAVSIERRYRWVKQPQKLLRIAFKAIWKMTGLTVVPALSLAIEKGSRDLVSC